MPGLYLPVELWFVILGMLGDGDFTSCYAQGDAEGPVLEDLPKDEYFKERVTHIDTHAYVLIKNPLYVVCVRAYMPYPPAQCQWRGAAAGVQTDANTLLSSHAHTHTRALFARTHGRMSTRQHNHGQQVL